MQTSSDFRLFSRFAHVCRLIAACSLLLLPGLFDLEAQAQEPCANFGYFVETNGFDCPRSEGQVCLVYSLNYSDPSCATGFHFEVTFPHVPFIASNLLPFQEIEIDNPEGNDVLRLDPLLVFDGELRTCFDVFIFEPGFSMTVEWVNDSDRTDRRFPITFVPDAVIKVGSPGTITTLSSLIAAGTLPAGGSAGNSLSVDGRLLVDVDYTFTNSGTSFGPSRTGQILMEPGASIEINGKRELTLNRTRVAACDTRWDRILVNDEATLTTIRSSIGEATVAVDLLDGAQLAFGASLLYDSEIGIRAAEPGDAGPTILVGANRFEFSRIANCDNGIYYDDAGTQVLIGAMSISGSGENGIYLHDTDLTVGARLSGSASVPFLIEKCLNSGINAAGGVDMLNVNAVSLVDCRNGVSSWGTTLLSLTESYLFNNYTGLFSYQAGYFGFPNLSARPTRLTVLNNEFVSNAYDVAGLEAETSALIRDNRFEATEAINVALFGTPGFRQIWRVDDNAMDALSHNAYLISSTAASLTFNDGMEADRNVEVGGGSRVRIRRNRGQGYGGISALLNGSPESLMECNRWNDVLALQILGNSLGTQLRGNNLSGSGYNLAYGGPNQGFGVTGPQIHNGNLFDPSSPANPKAVHFSGASRALRDMFLVGSSSQIGSPLLPYHIPTGWFGINGGVDFECLPPAIIPSGPKDALVELGIELHNNDDAGDQREDSDIKLYRHLLELAEEQALTASQTSIRTKLAARNWAPVVEAVHGLSLAQATLDQDSSTRQATITEVSEQAERSFLYNPVVYDSVASTFSIDMVAVLALESLRDSIAASLAQLDQTFSSYLVAREQAIVNGNQLIPSAIDTGQMAEPYRFATAQWFGLLAGDSLAESARIALRNLAAECPSVKGEGVFIARTLITAIDTDLELRRTWCDESGAGNQLPSSTEDVITRALTLTLAPNPVRAGATTRVTLAAAPTAQVLTVVDLHGRSLVSAEVAPGVDQMPIPTAGLPPGVYFVRIAPAAEPDARPGQTTVAKLVVGE